MLLAARASSGSAEISEVARPEHIQDRHVPVLAVLEVLLLTSPIARRRECNEVRHLLASHLGAAYCDSRVTAAIGQISYVNPQSALITGSSAAKDRAAASSARLAMPAP